MRCASPPDSVEARRSSVFDGHAADLRDVLAVDFDLARFGAQARAIAGGADGVSAVSAEENAHVELVLLALEVLEESADAAEAAVAVDDGLLVFGIEFKPGHVEWDFRLARVAF